MDEEMIKKIRAIMPDQIANKIVSVQPMPSASFVAIYDHSKSEEELKKEGYKPVSQMGMMWIKEEK